VTTEKGSFRVEVRVENPRRPGEQRIIPAVLVDTGWTGHALVTVAGNRTADDVVFGESCDLILLGSRSLEGLNLRVEPVSRQLVDAGPAPAAVAD
jgi:hypothetical protein